MPELRKDPVIGRWVIVATERARRPGNIVEPQENKVDEDQCPFCEHRENQTPPEIYAIRKNHHVNSAGWDVRVVPSINPILRIEGDLDHHGHGLYDMLQGVGAHEVIIETPKHTANMADLEVKHIEMVLKTYAHRINDLEGDARFKYVLAYKNYGWTAGGGSIRHARSQIIATPVIPMRVKEELVGSKKYFEYHGRCLYCDLVNQELASRERVVLENDHFVAVTPFASRFPFEVWILPKTHNCDFAKSNANAFGDLASILKNILQKLKIGLNDPAYNYIIHSAPFRRKNGAAHKWATIEEDYHWHIEIMPRISHVAGFEKGTGFYICPIPPEHTADFLRKVKV